MKILEAEFIKSGAQLSDCPKEDLPEIALVGRSNVGKSSLLNCLLQRKRLARVSGTPGKTRLMNFFKVTVGPRPRLPFYLVDLPGYGYAKASIAQREAWGTLVENYLAHRTALRCLVVLFDIRHEPTRLDRQLLVWVDHYRIPCLFVATKSDQLPRGGRPSALRKIQETLSRSAAVQDILPFSSETGEGREALLQRILQVLQA